jgi:hypothetical protein
VNGGGGGELPEPWGAGNFEGLLVIFLSECRLRFEAFLVVCPWRPSMIIAASLSVSAQNAFQITRSDPRKSETDKCSSESFSEKKCHQMKVILRVMKSSSFWKDRIRNRVRGWMEKLLWAGIDEILVNVHVRCPCNMWIGFRYAPNSSEVSISKKTMSW